MAIWCEKDGKNVMITCPQDFESLVEPSVYSAILEFFGCDIIGSRNYSDRIRELEDEIENVRCELEEEKDDLEYEYCKLEDNYDEMKSILKHVKEFASNTTETKEIAEYLEASNVDLS